MDQIMEELKSNLVELQTIIDKTSSKALDKLSKGDKVRLTAINEYLCQALLYANNLGK